MKLIITNLKLISSYQPLVALKPTTPFIHDIFAADLDGDGSQEFVITGRQSNESRANWSNSTVHIFHSTASGWEDVTTKWLPDNVVVGSEPSVLFGDFNHDGLKDFFIAGDTDTSYLAPSFLFLNTGTSFTKQSYDFQSWAHGSFSADLNKDGFTDVLTTDYGTRIGVGFGSTTGITFKPQTNQALWNASGICAADFLGDGSMTILASDIEFANDTALFSWRLGSSGELLLTKISTLPLPRFELPKWASYGFSDASSQDISHDIRVLPFDFSGDGLMDAIVISRPWLTNGSWPEYSEIQFLLNQGGGQFQDVTDTKLLNYNNASPASYQPVFLDVNADGRTDIFLSSQDFTTYNSTVLLLQQANGTFTEFGRDEFSALWSQAVQLVKDFPVNGWVYSQDGNPMQLVTGIDGKTYVVGTVAYQNAQGGMSEMVYSAEFLITDDYTPPTVVISSDVSNLTTGKTANFIFTLSEASTNFVAGDITVSGGTLSNFSGSGTTYTALFTPTPNSTNNALVSVASGVFTNAAGNTNADGSDANNKITLAVDTVVPTIAVSSSKSSLQGGDSASLTFTLSEASTNFEASDITTTGGTLSNFAGSGTAYTASFTLVSNSAVVGTLNVASGVFTDAAGNKNADGSDTNNSLNFARIATVTNESHTLSVVVGTSASEIFKTSIGNDSINGGGGIDTLVVSAGIGNYSVTKTPIGYTLVDRTGSDGTDALLNIESIKFSDKTINLTLQAKAASAPQADVTRLVELYTAFFNRVPDADGMSFWIDEMKAGKTTNQVAEAFYNAGVNYSSLTGFSSTMTNTDFINVIYKNVLGRKDGADAGGLSFWETEITSGRANRGTLVTNILDSAHTFKGDKTWGWVADLLDNKITVAKKFSIDMGLNYNTPEESITMGMAIASAITSTDTTAAVTLIGVTEANFQLS
jgi:hypothetical protein